MSPAASLVWIVIAVAAAWLFVTTAVPAALKAVVALGVSFRPLSKPVAVLVTSFLLAVSFRHSPSTASVPPPSQRVVVDSAQDSGSSTVRNPITERVAVSTGTKVHEVVRGDSLWAIARQAIETLDREPTGTEITKLWKEIYAVNSAVIGGDPNLIHPGQLLTIPGGIRG